MQDGMKLRNKADSNIAQVMQRGMVNTKLFYATFCTELDLITSII